MKLINKKNIAGLVSVMAISVLTSCSDVPSFPDSDIADAGTVSSTIDGENVTVNPVEAKLPSSFIRGFDASAVNDSGAGVYRTASGVEKDIFEILPEYGINWVRLRVWNNPQSSKNPAKSTTDSTPDVAGASDKSVVVNQAVRAKNAGLKILLDFHYSDFWADPGKQLIPEAWLGASDATEMGTNVYNYTKEVLSALKEAGVQPNMIQIGNEINSGILVHSSLTTVSTGHSVTAASSAVSGASGGNNFTAYLAKGIEAAREVCPGSKIMLHAAGANPSRVKWLFEKFKAADLDYDVIGLSYYPAENSHGTISVLGSTIASFKSTFGKEVIVAETNASWKTSSGVLDDNSQSNLSISESEKYPGLIVDSNGKVTASLQNQANIVRAVIEVTAANGGAGVFEWGGEYKGDWKGMFTGDGKPLPSLCVFGVNGK